MAHSKSGITCTANFGCGIELMPVRCDRSVVRRELSLRRTERDCGYFSQYEWPSEDQEEQKR